MPSRGMAVELIYYPKTDIKITSFHAIANILKEEGQEFYIDLLRNPKFPEKFSVIKAINQYCTVNASKDVLERLVKIVKGKRRSVYYDKDMSELTTCLQYFLRINSPEAFEAFRIIKDKASELEPNEVSWIKNNIPNLI